MVKIAIGSIGDSFSVTSIKSYVAEFIATLLFVFAGVGSAIAYSKWLIKSRQTYTNLLICYVRCYGFFNLITSCWYAFCCVDKLTSDASLDPAGLVAIAIAHAFALFVGVSMAANISGGHLNPAVTLGLAVGGNITIITGLFYWIAQCLGSIVACFLLSFVTNGLVRFISPTSNIAVSQTTKCHAKD